MSDNPLVVFKQNLTGLIDKKELALPSNVNPEAFKNAAIVAAQDNPKILACDMQSVFKSIRTLAAAGLVPDGREAALVPFKTKDGDRWVEKCQAMPMVFGLIKMVRRSGEVSDIRAHIVYQNEVDQGRFEYVVGDAESLRHEPILFGEKGPAVAAYAIAILKDGNIVREFMGADEIDTVRRSSSAQKVYRKGEKPITSDTPIGIWADWAEQMWKKSVIRRLCKRLDMSSEDMRRVMVEQDQDIRDITPSEPKPTRLQQLAAKVRGQDSEDLEPDEAEPDDAPEVEDAQTVDIHWTETVDADSGFPGSDEWTSGAKAYTAGMKRTMCPHQDDRGKAADWLGGFDGAGRAAE